MIMDIEIDEEVFQMISEHKQITDCYSRGLAFESS